MKVLVAEDERDIAESYRDMFKKRGYYFQIAYDGKECVRMYREAAKDAESGQQTGKPSSAAAPQQQPLPFDVVILDYKMPRMNGMESAKEILKIRPRQRVMFISAVLEDVLADSIKNLDRIVELVRKPFDIWNLRLTALSSLIVELVRKPFDPKRLIEAIEDAEIYHTLEKMNVGVRLLMKTNPDQDQLVELLAGLRQIMKSHTF
ncbi:MAG: hypothetical protein C4292_01690 [Nitrososphaera sp.]